MSSDRELVQAVQLIQQNKKEAGARMLSAVLRKPDLDNRLRAVGYTWLAETRDDLNFRIQCLNSARDADPDDPEIQIRLNKLLAKQPQRSPFPVQRPPQDLNIAQQRPKPPNPAIPQSQKISLPSPEMSESQWMRSIRADETQNNPQGTTGNQRVQDPQQLMNQINPPPPTGDTGSIPTLSDYGEQWTSGTQSPVNPPPPPPQNYQSGPPNPNTRPQPPEQNTWRQPPQPLQDNAWQQQPNPQNQPPQPGYSPSLTPHKLQQAPQVVGILHGPNGNGSGVFVTSDGLIATTRYVVGGSTEVMVAVDTHHETMGKVVRSFPRFDLSLVHVNVQLERVWPSTPMSVINAGEAFTAIGYNGIVVRANHRKSKNQVERHWIPTTAAMVNMDDAGGNAMYDSNNYLMGILTRNYSRDTGFVYGLHIQFIYEKIHEYLASRQAIQNPMYCCSCGNLSRAHNFGGYYCETCGSVLPSFEKVDRKNRQSSQLMQVYRENLSQTCPNCRGRVGYYDGQCLRCGYDMYAKDKR